MQAFVTLLKKRLWRRCFHLNFGKFLRTPFLQNISGGCFLVDKFKLLKICRSSHPEAFLGKVVAKICSKFTGEHPCRSVVSLKLQSNFIEIAPKHFPVNMLHIFRTPFAKTTSGRLLLNLLKTRVLRINFTTTEFVGFKLNVLDVFWTSYVRLIYVLCLRGEILTSYIYDSKKRSDLPFPSP